MDSSTTSFQHRSLTQQGYDYSTEQLRELEWGLRFTPTVCMLGAIYALLTQQPALHFALAALGIVPFWFPAWHPLDRFYNHALRPMWGGVELPPNPLPRRIACAMGGAMNIGIGASFVAGSVFWAYVFAGILIPLQLIVITSHFCVASWMYEGLLRLLGKWQPTISLEEAKDLLEHGALLVDVRTPAEYAKSHIRDALNFPVDELTEHLEELRGKTAVLYCRSGARCQQAVQVLKKNCEGSFHIFGAEADWRE